MCRSVLSVEASYSIGANALCPWLVDDVVQAHNLIAAPDVGVAVCHCLDRVVLPADGHEATVEEADQEILVGELESAEEVGGVKEFHHVVPELLARVEDKHSAVEEIVCHHAVLVECD